MNSTSSNLGLWRYALSALATGLFFSTVHAQQSERGSDLLSPTERLQEISELVVNLDTLARNCLNTPPAAVAANPHCQSLIAAIDGQEVARYLQHCTELKDWRDRFINRYQESATREDITDTAALEVLVQTEFWCGEEALRERTSAVFPAFAALNGERPANQSAVNPGGAPTYSATLRSRTGASQNMQERLRLETERLWLDLRIENLRQQLP